MRVEARVVRRWVVAITSLVAIAWLLRAGPREAWRALVAVLDTARHLPAGAVAAALALGVLQNVAAIGRLHVLARPPGSAFETIRRLAFPQLLNAIAPARAGDLAKLAVVAEHAGVARAAGSVLVADKVADVAGGAIALVVAVPAGGTALGVRGWQAVLLSLLAAGAIAFVASIAATRLRARGPIAQYVSALLDGLAAPRRLAGASIVAAIGWLAEAAALLVLARAAGAALSPGGAMLALLILNVGILVPILPANAGAFEAALGFALARMGVAAPTAVAVSAVHHGTQLLATALLALLSLSGRRRTPRGISQPDKARAIDSYHQRAPRYEAMVSAGLLYRAEKRVAGLSVNPYRAGWLAVHGAHHGPPLAGGRRPLSSNQVLVFEAERTDPARGSGSPGGAIFAPS